MVAGLVARGDGSQRTGTALAERALEPPLLPERLVARAARGALRGERADAAARNAREADRRSEIEERLRARRAERLAGALLDAEDVRVDREHVAAEGEVADRGGRVRPDTGQLCQVLGPAGGGDRARRPVETDCAAVVAEPLPLEDHVRRRRGGECFDRRPAREPGVPARDHTLDLRLLQHHLAHEDRVRVACLPPGEVAPVVPEPGKQKLLHGSEPREPSSRARPAGRARRGRARPRRRPPGIPRSSGAAP